MNIFGKFFIFSIFILFASYFVYKSLDDEKNERCGLIMVSALMEIVTSIDRLLEYVYLPGFYRFVEHHGSNLRFYNVDKSQLNVEIKVFDGVEVILFDPIKHDKHRPAILYFHGGGWSLLNPKFQAPFTADLARQLNTLIVSVDYRKAPEHPYPAAFHDVLAATKYFLINAERFDVDPNRVALMGDSAGGNLALVVGYNLCAHKRLHKNIRVPKVLIPLNPVLQMADLHTPSYRDHADNVMLSRDKMAKFYCMYAFGRLSQPDMDICKSTMTTNGHMSTEALEAVKANIDWHKYLKGDGYDNHPPSTFTHKVNRFSKRLSELALDPAFSPVSALNDTEIALLPPVYLLGASKDPLRDDSKLLAARLKHIGHAVGYKEFNHHHVTFLFDKVKLKPLEAFNMILKIFEENPIL